MTRVAGWLWCAMLAAQTLPEAEQEHLRKVLAGGSSSPADLIQALEAHLKQFPNSARKDEMERTIAKAAIQAQDTHRTARYGWRALTADPEPTLFDPVCRALVVEKNADALKCSKQFEAFVREAMKGLSASIADRGRRKDEMDRMLGKALLYQALPTAGNAEAAALAQASFDAYPAGDAALELAKRSALLDKRAEAIRWYADAFTIPDSQASDLDRAIIRSRMGELYRAEHDGEAGLGDIVLKSYDRMAALLAARRAMLKQFDPNFGAANPLDFTLPAWKGPPVALRTLAGKVVILDFWATWCGPCRAQHPLYDEVKKRFAERRDVVFLSINTDEERELVGPFLEAQGWKNTVYFDDGLGRLLRVTNIPTTVVFGKSGAVVSRMNGYDPPTFVDTLSGRIGAALGEAK